MTKYDRVPRARLAESLIRIDLKAMPAKHSYFVVLILEINGAVIVLKSPYKRITIFTPGSRL